MLSHWLLRSSFMARSASARRLTMASVGEADGLLATIVPPGLNPVTFAGFFCGTAPLEREGPRSVCGRSEWAPPTTLVGC